jgi:hypothetical protein
MTSGGCGIQHPPIMGGSRGGSVGGSMMLAYPAGSLHDSPQLALCGVVVPGYRLAWRAAGVGGWSHSSVSVPVKPSGQPAHMQPRDISEAAYVQQPQLGMVGGCC